MLQTWKDVTAIVQSIATVLALVIGGVWTYMIFIQHRQNKPALEVSQVVQQFCLPDHLILLSVKEVLKNSSPVKVELESGETRVVPIPISTLENGDAENSRTDKAAEWPKWQVPASMVSIHQWNDTRRFIEPSESEIFENHFLISQSVGLVSIMTFVANKAEVANPEEKNPEKRRLMSWKAITDYDLRSGSCSERSDHIMK